jgi:hypothetical protein
MIKSTRKGRKQNNNAIPLELENKAKNVTYRSGYITFKIDDA